MVEGPPERLRTRRVVSFGMPVSSLVLLGVALYLRPSLASAGGLDVLSAAAVGHAVVVTLVALRVQRAVSEPVPLQRNRSSGRRSRAG